MSPFTWQKVCTVDFSVPMYPCMLSEYFCRIGLLQYKMSVGTTPYDLCSNKNLFDWVYYGIKGMVRVESGIYHGLIRLFCYIRN